MNYKWPCHTPNCCLAYNMCFSWWALLCIHMHGVDQIPKDALSTNLTHTLLQYCERCCGRHHEICILDISFACSGMLSPLSKDIFAHLGTTLLAHDGSMPKSIKKWKQKSLPSIYCPEIIVQMSCFLTHLLPQCLRYLYRHEATMWGVQSLCERQ